MTSTQTRSPGPPGGGAPAAYRRVRETTEALVTADPDAATVQVEHCPGWTVRDLVAHLVEVCARVHDRVTGLPPAPAPGPRAGLPELLARWAELSGPVEEFLAGPASMDRGILVMDAFTHELDLRRALGAAPPEDHPALPVAIHVLVTGLTASLAGHGLPALAVRSGHGLLVAGTGEPAATVSGHWYDVYLSLAGRRTEAQIRSLRWSEDPRRWLPAFTWGPFRVPEAVAVDGTPGSAALDGVR
ncbi:maleylpyruvate isomerase family mycothiol-dependent enzyme [Micromonospora fluostatini]|uniref:maleylpyruvate isomerase family mycothiol-dependent enzyme n=1 Tax=Micromonospora sp. JCM 30529 TaxID=3421643 RepID=UPI003D163054